MSLAPDFDEDLRINFSEVEARGSIDPLPTGKYHVKVTDGEIKPCGPASNNPGKPYINWEFTVQDGQYENRRCWTNAMLFEPALFTMKNMLEVVGAGDQALKISELIPFMVGKDMIIKVVKRAANEEKGWDESNEVKGFFPYDGSETPAAAAKSSLLP
jgi:Protein of unknown function (DUF669)